NRKPTKIVPKIAKIFQRSKCSMSERTSPLELVMSHAAPNVPWVPPTACVSLFRDRRVLDRLALRADVEQRAPEYAHLERVRKLDVDLVRIVRHARHLADEAAGGHHRIAAAHLLDHLAMLLLALVLRPDHEEVEDHHHQQHRDEKPAERVGHWV